LKKTFFVLSLGCFRNLYDSQIIIQEYLNKGFKLRKEPEEIDLLIINTCGFIKEAKEESISAIKEALKLKKKRKIKRVCVRGCLVSRYFKQLKYYFPQVDEWEGILSTENKAYFFKKRLTPPHIAFLKICDGCLYNCSFCAIPLIKGKLKSRSYPAIIEEVKFLDKEGVKELNIIGQNTTSWGKDLYKDKDLVFLLKKILKNTKNIKWIRLLYLHPQEITDELLDLIANEERLCKYIDLPVQHISDRILRLMNRKMRKKEILKLIKKIRKKIPQVALRTSIIVGFPSETESEFSQLLEFIKKVKFEKLGAFIYSREENTPAYKMKPQIHYQVKKRRFNQLMQIQKEISYQLNKRFIGKRIGVIIDSKEEENLYLGRTQFDCYEVDGLVYVKRKNLKVGRIYKIKIVDAYEYDLVGE